MSVLGQLAGALGRNDERPNVELAERLAEQPDTAAIAELVAALTTGSTAVQNDAIKVLYELGARRPELVASHTDAFLTLLKSRNNRSVWGALQAIETVTPARPSEILAALDIILAAADKGSVIAKDKAIAILVNLAAAGHGSRVLPILLDRLGNAAPNQFPMYAEQIGTIVGPEHLPRLLDVLERRLGKIEQSSKRARVEKLLRKLMK